MNNLIKVNTNENGDVVVSGRELHEFLESKEPYTQWFDRMVEYGFAENVDFFVFQNFVKDDTAFGGVRKSTDHAIKLDMAKELAMIQRNDKGKQARQYFIAIEKEYNSPEKIMARALRIAEDTISNLTTNIMIKDQQILELQPKATYYDLILQCKDLLSVTEISKDYGMSAKTLNNKLNDLGVQYKQSGVWFLYSKYQDKGYTQTKTHNYSRPNGTQGSAVHTYWTQKGRLFIYDLLKNNGIVPLIEKESA